MNALDKIDSLTVDDFILVNNESAFTDLRSELLDITRRFIHSSRSLGNTQVIDFFCFSFVSLVFRCLWSTAGTATEEITNKAAAVWTNLLLKFFLSPNLQKRLFAIKGLVEWTGYIQALTENTKDIETAKRQQQFRTKHFIEFLSKYVVIAADISQN